MNIWTVMHHMIYSDTDDKVLRTTRNDTDVEDLVLSLLRDPNCVHITLVKRVVEP